MAYNLGLLRRNQFVPMKLWKAKSGSYETHFFSALFRSLFTNSCWIFATSLFVKSVGSKGFAQLYFFASICSLLYYIYFVLRGHKDNEPFNVYKVTLSLALLASVAAFLEPSVPLLHPLQSLLLYFFIVSVMSVDLIGTTLGPMVLQASVNPAIFRQVYQQIVSAEVMARIGAAALVWILSGWHNLAVIWPIVWLMLILHFIFFGITVLNMHASEGQSKVTRVKQTPVGDTIYKSMQFIFANPLVRVAMIVLVWSTVTKFVLEYLFYQVADARFGSAREIASFLSALMMTIYVLSLVVHHFISRILISRLQLSTLLSFQPVNIVVLGATALLLPPFWPLVLLMVTYNIIHRSIQLPMSRQCLVPVPRNQRGIIVSLISIIIAVATMVTSGGMAILKNSLHMQDFLVLLLGFGAAIFFMITSLDSYYIRNLWSFFKEVRSGNWQNEPQLETFSAAVLESDGVAADNAGVLPPTALKSHPILESYAFSFDETKLLSASTDHRKLLGSLNLEDLIVGLRICFLADFPWFAAPLTQAAAHQELNVRKFAQRAIDVDRWFASMSNYSSVSRRRIKTFALELLENNEDADRITALKNLINYPDAAMVQSLIDVVTDSRFRELRHLVLECICEEGSRLTVKPIVDGMYEVDYRGAGLYRKLLEQLPFGKKSGEVRATIEANLSTLKREQLSLGTPSASAQTPNLQPFMHTLFLEEYRLSARELDTALIDTIGEFQAFSPEETGILTDMHLSFLKRSERFSFWDALMS